MCHTAEIEVSFIDGSLDGAPAVVELGHFKAHALCELGESGCAQLVGHVVASPVCTAQSREYSPLLSRSSS